MATAREVAEWMANEVATPSRLPQKTAVSMIRRQFGEEHAYRNKNRNWAISEDVFKEFEELTRETVVWIVGKRAWRLRRDGDAEGRAVKR
jgi:hypothetical protein